MSSVWQKLGIILLGTCFIFSLYAGVILALKEPKQREEISSIALFGTWRSKDSNGPKMVATVSADRIEIQWNDVAYWRGSLYAPDFIDTTKDTVIVSRATNEDLLTMENSILGSADDEKIITFRGNDMSFQTSAVGTTQTVHLAKKE